jgi:hypothetical protein
MNQVKGFEIDNEPKIIRENGVGKFNNFFLKNLKTLKYLEYNPLNNSYDYKLTKGMTYAIYGEKSNGENGLIEYLVKDDFNNEIWVQKNFWKELFYKEINDKMQSYKEPLFVVYFVGNDYFSFPNLTKGKKYNVEEEISVDFGKNKVLYYQVKGDDDKLVTMPSNYFAIEKNNDNLKNFSDNKTTNTWCDIDLNNLIVPELIKKEKYCGILNGVDYLSLKNEEDIKKIIKENFGNKIFNKNIDWIWDDFKKDEFLIINNKKSISDSGLSLLGSWPTSGISTFPTIVCVG